MIAKKLASVPHVAVASPAYLDNHGHPHSPADLIEHTCLSYAYVAGGDEWRFLKGDVEFAVQVKCGLRSNCTEVLRVACIGGRGIAIEPATVAEDDLEAGLLIEVLPGYRPAEYGSFVVYPVDSLVPVSRPS